MSIPLEEQLLFKNHRTLKNIADEGWPIHVFVNPTEYHGPHLSLGNDRIISERVARKLHQRLCLTQGDMPFLVGGNIDFGCDPCPGTGSTGLTYNALKNLIEKMADGLADLGMTRIIFHTFHGSPFHNNAIHHAMDRLNKKGIRALNVFDLTTHMILNFDAKRYQPLRELLSSEEAFQQVMKSLPFDTHAGLFETSVALFVAPETVDEDYVYLPACPDIQPNAITGKLVKRLSAVWSDAHELEHTAVTIAWTNLRPFPGYTGIPSMATADIGRFYVEELILPQYEAATLDVLWGNGDVPQSPFSWSKPLSSLIGGRFSPE